MLVALTIAALTVALCIAIAAWLLQPPKMRSGGDLRLHRVAPDIYLYRGYFSNSAVLVLPDGVVVVDTQVSPRAGKRLADEIAKVTDKPVKLIALTHYHGDHSGGSAAFPGVPIVCSELCARYCVERDQERIEYANTFGLQFQHIHPTEAPTQTFSGKLSIDTCGDRIELEQLGASETPDCIVVRWPSRKVLCCGDGVATIDYPFLGVPFLDEGLRDDGAWLGFLRAIRDEKPEILLPGHGPALVGDAAIGARLSLLLDLFETLLSEVRVRLERKLPTARIVEEVDLALSRFRRRDLYEQTVGQRFAIYRAINNLSPDRKGRGWWHDLRPSVIVRAPKHDIAELLAASPTSESVCRVAEALAPRDRPRAIALLEAFSEAHPEQAAPLALLSDVLFDGSQTVHPKVDATEYIVASAAAAKRALAIDPNAPLALLSLGMAEVFGAMILAQDTSVGAQKIQRALDSSTLHARQQRKARFFLAKALQMELRDEEADRAFSSMFPAALRWLLFPLLRAKLRAIP